MKRSVLLVLSVLSVLSVAFSATAHAAQPHTQTPASFVNELRHLDDDHTSLSEAWDSGFIQGVESSDPKVCVNSFTSVNTVARIVADGIEMNPKYDHPLNVGEVIRALVDQMESQYPCTK